MESPEQRNDDADAPQTTDAPAHTPTGDGGASRDVVLSLNFIPSWAKQSPAENPYAAHEGGQRMESARGERRGFRGDDRGRREGGRPGGRPGGGGRPAGVGGRDFRRDDRGPRRDDRPQQGERRGPPRDERRDAPRGGARHDDRRGGGRGPQRDREFVPRLPVNVSFVPDRTYLGAVVKDIHDKRRAYPLAMLAALFLQKPEHHMVKFEVQSSREKPGGLKLWQNAKTGMVFLSRETAQGFAVARDLEEFFERQDIPVDAPTGNFVCVGRCTLSGELLGPPNHHGYQEKLQEMHRTRFAHLPLDVYRGKIEVVRDPALVEQWKEQARTVSRFKEKAGSEGEAKLRRSEAEFIFLEKYAKDLFKQGARFLVPGRRAPELPDPELRRLVREAWTRESRFPMTLLFALRAAFKHMRLVTFKVGNETFATAIPPKPLDAVHVVEQIQTMITLLREHPGWTRKDLVEHAKPGLDPESPEALELLSPLRWLIDKGHVIEFFNGTLSLPADVPAKPAPAAPAARNDPGDAAAVPDVTAAALPTEAAVASAEEPGLSIASAGQPDLPAAPVDAAAESPVAGGPSAT